MRKMLVALLFVPLLAGTPVEDHGALKVVGNRVVDKAGTPVSLAGMSLFWPCWGGEKYQNKDVVNWLVSDWKCNLVRVPVGVEPKGGYLDNPVAAKAMVREAVDAAIAHGVYVIIDWHDHHAQKHLKPSKAFFEEMAKAYGDTPNVLFEIYNEPVDVAWSKVKAYSESVIPVIRKYSQNLIIVGTPQWSQNVDQAADDPPEGTNLAYSLHFYAGTHEQWLRDKGDYAMKKGKALFVSEWGTTHADGGGHKDRKVYKEASEVWLKWMEQNQISWANWSIVDKDEASAALVPGASPKGGWTESALTDSGRWVKAQIARANGIKTGAPKPVENQEAASSK
jgi:endoglucanase